MELADCLRMAALIPAPGIGKSEVKGRASQSCTVRARPAASSPPSAAQSERSGPLGVTSPSPRPCLLVQELETSASCWAGEMVGEPGFLSLFGKRVTATRKRRRAGNCSGQRRRLRDLGSGVGPLSPVALSPTCSFPCASLPPFPPLSSTTESVFLLFSLFFVCLQSLGLTLFLLLFLQMVLPLACFGRVSPSFSSLYLLPITPLVLSV